MSHPADITALATYWAGIHKALHGRLLSVQDYLRHPSSGINAENYFRDLLRQYLPRKFAVESGFVVNASGERSDFIDILIVDCQHIPPLSAEPHFKIFAAEAVVAAIEVTLAPKAFVRKGASQGNAPKLEDDALKLARVRQIARERSYITSVAVKGSAGISLENVSVNFELSPRAFLITCGDEWAKSETYEKHLLAALNSASDRHEHVWLNAVLSMQHGMFHFKPFTTFEYECRQQNALLEFLLFVNNAISSYHTYPIDLQRYRPTVPSAADESNNK